MVEFQFDSYRLLLQRILTAARAIESSIDGLMLEANNLLEI